MTAEPRKERLNVQACHGTIAGSTFISHIDHYLFPLVIALSYISRIWRAWIVENGIGQEIATASNE